MSIRRVAPDLRVGDPAAAARFYVETLGFDLVMDLGWVAVVAAPDNPTAQIILMREDASAPVPPDLSIEIGDVDAAYAAVQAEGAEIVHPLTDEPWGVRRFFFRDADGNVVNVLNHG